MTLTPAQRAALAWLQDDRWGFGHVIPAKLSSLYRHHPSLVMRADGSRPYLYRLTDAGVKLKKELGL